MELPTFRFSYCKKGKLFHISLTTQLYLHERVCKKPEFENAPQWFKVKLKTHSRHRMLCFFTQLCTTLFTSCCIFLYSVKWITLILLYYSVFTLYTPYIQLREVRCHCAPLSTYKLKCRRKLRHVIFLFILVIYIHSICCCQANSKINLQT